MKVFPCAISLFIILLSLSACSNKMGEKPKHADIELPEHFSRLENLSVYSPDIQPTDTVILTPTTIFESNEEVFLEGSIWRFTIDDHGRVYINAGRPGSVGIYVFEPDGTFLTRFARIGRGPGEFEAIISQVIFRDKIYLFDARLQKAGIFSLEDFSHVRDFLVDYRLLERGGERFLHKRANRLYVIGENEYLVRLGSNPRLDETESDQILYVRMDSTGTLLPEVILQQDNHRVYMPKEALAMPYTMPFDRSSLFTLSDNGQIYTNWTENFLIKVYDSEGNYERAIYHTINSVLEVSMDEFQDRLEYDPIMRRTLQRYELRSSWPVVHTMEVDDEGRIWVAIIIDSDSMYQWWLLNHDGSLSARFTKSGKRYLRSPLLKPRIVIKNGYFYTHEFNLRKGIDRLVKYKIDIEERRND